MKSSIVPCSRTECTNKLCPNYNPIYIKGSFHFPDCIEVISGQMGQKISRTSQDSSEME